MMTITKLKDIAKLSILFLIAATLLSSVLVTGVKAQTSGVTVGEWSLGQVQTSSYSLITPCTAGVARGILGGDPEPALVEGRFGKALQFNGENFVYVPIKFIIGFPPSPRPIYMPVSPSLDVQKQIEIEAWINNSGLKDATYNNIVVKATHSDDLFSSLTSEAIYWHNVTRIVGLSVRGAYLPEEGKQAVGALSGFVLTDTGGFNEIVTTHPVPLNQWINVAFSRTATGMHIYVNGYEQNVNVIHGVQNPQGNILNGTEYYFGHDGLATIQNVRIIDLDPSHIAEAAFDIGSNIMIVVVVVSVVFAVAWVLRRLIQLWLIRPKL
jgi:Concanavalin A-like lectin/glucanases superfamily